MHFKYSISSCVLPEFALLATVFKDVAALFDVIMPTSFHFWRCLYSVLFVFFINY